MRRLIALVTCLSIVVVGSATRARTAGADMAPAFSVRGVSVAEPGEPTSRLEVRGGSPNGIATIKVTVRHWRVSEIVGTVDDFDLVSGTAEDGVWRSRSAIALTRRNFHADLRVVDGAANEHTVTDQVLLNGPQPEIADFTITPSTVDIENRTISFSGRFFVRANDGTEQPINLHHVCLRKVSLGEPYGGCAGTGKDGRFSGTYALYGLGSGDYRLESSVGPVYRPATTSATWITVEDLRTALSLAAETPTTVVAQEVAALSGRVTRLSRSGEWAPLADVKVRLSFSCAAPCWSTPYDDYEKEAVTAADGSFRVSVPVRASGSWHAFARKNGYLRSVAKVGFSARHRTEVTDFTATPDIVGKGDQLTLGGRLVRPTSQNEHWPITGGLLELEYSSDGRQWRRRTSGRTDERGYFTIATTALADGYWRVRFAANTPGDNGAPDTPDLPVTSEKVWADVRYRTVITSFDAGPEPVRKGKTLTISGVLKRSVDGSTFVPFANRPVTIAFWVKGAKTARFLQAKTDKYGRFRKSVKATKDATWQAWSQGDLANLRVEGPTDYVDVR